MDLTPPCPTRQGTPPIPSGEPDFSKFRAWGWATALSQPPPGQPMKLDNKTTHSPAKLTYNKQSKELTIELTPQNSDHIPLALTLSYDQVVILASLLKKAGIHAP